MTKTRIKIQKESCLCVGLNFIDLYDVDVRVVDSFSYSVAIEQYRDDLASLYCFVGNLKEESRGPFISVLYEREE